MKKSTFLLFALAIMFGALLAVGCSSDPEERTYEDSYNADPYQSLSDEDKQYLDNSLSTGSVPYRCTGLYGSESSITVNTSYSSNCDLVVILKRNGTAVRNAYICAGGSFTFDLPNGSYQVFFYGGTGWNPNKVMPNGERGGFVMNESYSKDTEVYLDYQGLSYDLTPQRGGNFSTSHSTVGEIF